MEIPEAFLGSAREVRARMHALARTFERRHAFQDADFGRLVSVSEQPMAPVNAPLHYMLFGETPLGPAIQLWHLSRKTPGVHFRMYALQEEMMPLLIERRLARDVFRSWLMWSLSEPWKFTTVLGNTGLAALTEHVYPELRVPCLRAAL